MEEILVRTQVVGPGTENRPERLRRVVVAISMVVVVVGVTMRNSFLVERDLLDGDVRSRNPRPRRDRLSKYHGQRQGPHRRGGPWSTAPGTTRRAAQTHNCLSSRAMFARTA